MKNRARDAAMRDSGITKYAVTKWEETGQERVWSGPGTKTLDALDTFVILILYINEPSRGLPSYAVHLHDFTGTVVSERRFLSSKPNSS